MPRGVDTAAHMGRRVDRAAFTQAVTPTQGGGTASGWAAAGGGGTPPYNPNQEYLPVTGSPGMYYTPDRMMQVGIRESNAAQPGSIPLQRFPDSGEGLYSVQPDAPAAPSSAPGYEHYGMYPSQMSDIINTTQWQVS